MEVILLRHGQTAGNLGKKYIGSMDEPLCPEGAAGVRGFGEFTDIRRVYVSPMKRARQTAALLFPNAIQMVAEDLREMDFGHFEGKSASEMENDDIYTTWVNGMCRDRCPGGDSIAGFSERVQSAFRELILSAAQSGEDRVVIVSHGGTIMAIMDGFAVPGRDYFYWFSENCRGWRAKADISEDVLRLTDYTYIEELTL